MRREIPIFEELPLMERSYAAGMTAVQETIDNCISGVFDYIKIQSQNKILKPYAVLHTLQTFYTLRTQHT